MHKIIDSESFLSTEKPKQYNYKLLETCENSKTSNKKIITILTNTEVSLWDIHSNYSKLLVVRPGKQAIKPNNKYIY